MRNNRVLVKAIRCDNCDYEWFIANFRVKGWVQTAFHKTTCPRCQTNYTGFDIYSGEDLRVALHDSEKKVKGRW